MAGNTLGTDFSQVAVSGKLADPGDAGTLVLTGGMSMVHILAGSTTDSVVLPAAPTGSIVVLMNESAGDVEMSDGTSNVCTVADDEVGLAVSLNESTPLWRGVVLHSTST